MVSRGYAGSMPVLEDLAATRPSGWPLSAYRPRPPWSPPPPGGSVRRRASSPAALGPTASPSPGRAPGAVRGQLPPRAGSGGLLGPTGPARRPWSCNARRCPAGAGGVTVTGLPVAPEHLGRSGAGSGSSSRTPTTSCSCRRWPRTWPSGRPPRPARGRAGDQGQGRLAAVGMEEHAGRPPHHLSFGQRRQVAVATVLAMEPDILILDEPSSNLDPASRRELAEIVTGLGVTILMVTHDLPYALQLCPRALVMNGGRITADGRRASCWPTPSCWPPTAWSCRSALTRRPCAARSRRPRRPGRGGSEPRRSRPRMLLRCRRVGWPGGCRSPARRSPGRWPGTGLPTPWPSRSRVAGWPCSPAAATLLVGGHRRRHRARPGLARGHPGRPLRAGSHRGSAGRRATRPPGRAPCPAPGHHLPGPGADRTGGGRGPAGRPGRRPPAAHRHRGPAAGRGDPVLGLAWAGRVAESSAAPCAAGACTARTRAGPAPPHRLGPPGHPPRRRPRRARPPVSVA